MRFNVDKNVALTGGVGIGSLVVGFAAGYMFKKWRFEKEVDRVEAGLQQYVDEQLQLDFDQLVENAKASHPANKGVIQEVIVDGYEETEEDPTLVLIEETDDELVITFEDVPEEVDLETVNIFTNDDPNWQWDQELASRETDKPHVIHVDEFMANENDHNQRTLMYYVGDNVLCDEENIPIFNAHEVVGDNLSFGHGSQDQSIVYVRNTRLDAEYEIIKDDGYFQIEVLGAEIEDNYEAQDLKHSHTPHKFRE